MATITSSSCFSNPTIIKPSKPIHFSKSKPKALLCRCSSPFFLHDSLDAAGIDTRHARVAREGFCAEIGRLTAVTREMSIVAARGIDLARVALHVAEEDDSLVSHSSVPLPVDAFIRRLDDLSLGFCSLYSGQYRGNPEVFLEKLEDYLYLHKGFRRKASHDQFDTRALYLHSVLTCRVGSSAMLSIIYSETLKMLKLWHFFDFDVEILFPRDNVSLPRGYEKRTCKIFDHTYILTTQSLIVDMLRGLKDVFWPFQYDHTSTLFLRAANAASLGGSSFMVNKSSSPYDNISFEIASSKAAQHRLERGVWTNVRFGDMRRALAACERLILLDTDPLELRDYAVLLYHCGYYEESLLYLNLYQSARKKSPPTLSEELEEDAVQKLRVRLNLISMEDGWNRPAAGRNLWYKNSEPW